MSRLIQKFFSTNVCTLIRWLIHHPGADLTHVAQQEIPARTDVTWPMVAVIAIRGADT